MSNSGSFTELAERPKEGGGKKSQGKERPRQLTSLVHLTKPGEYRLGEGMCVCVLRGVVMCMCGLF